MIKKQCTELLTIHSFSNQRLNCGYFKIPPVINKLKSLSNTNYQKMKRSYIVDSKKFNYIDNLDLRFVLILIFQFIVEAIFVILYF